MCLNLMASYACAQHSACQQVLASKCCFAETKDCDPRCQWALKKYLNPTGLGVAHVFTDLGEFGRSMPPYCVGHGRHCWVPQVDVDMTGTPCQDFSQQGHREGPQGKQMWVFLAWVAAVLASDAAVVIHENVPQFWVELLVQHLGMKYHIYSMLVDCNDMGFGLISRQRRYSILYHKLKTNVRHSPVAVYGMLRQKCNSHMHRLACTPMDCFLASPDEVAGEMAMAAQSKNMPLHAALACPGLLFSPSEASHLEFYIMAWTSKYGSHPMFCPWAVFNLGDNPAKGYLTWSAASGKIPGLRTGGHKLWVPWLGRWLTALELLGAMGLPVYPELAEAARVKQWTVQPGVNPRHMLGNMMHVSSAGAVLAVALACVQII